MELAMTGFKLLFSNDDPMLSTLRNTGLNLFDRMNWLNAPLMKQAVGGKQKTVF